MVQPQNVSMGRACTCVQGNDGAVQVYIGAVGESEWMVQVVGTVWAMVVRVTATHMETNHDDD